MQECDSNKIIINATVDNIIYRNDRNGYTVCEMQGESEDFVAVGTLPFVQVGESLEISGIFNLHPDYGHQFQIEKYVKKSFTSLESIEKYLSSGLLKGIGAKIAKKIVKKFGLDTIEIIKCNPDRLTEIKGINSEKAEMFAMTLLKEESSQDLVMFLSSFDISSSTIAKIQEHFGENALTRIKENPYSLLRNGIGIRFQKADQIAFSFGWDSSSIIRIQSAILSVLTTALVNGNTYINPFFLIKEASYLISQNISTDEENVIKIFNHPQIIFEKENNIVSLKMAYLAEKEIAKSLIKRVKGTNRRDDLISIGDDVKKLCDNESVLFDDVQVRSACQCLVNPVTVITGGPGTGKTTIIRVLCKYMTQKGRKVLLAAPTGRAAKRMKDTTKYDAKTIHRLLELQYRSDVDDYNLVFARDKDNPLEADLLIIDEVSMLDLFLMRHLLEAVPKDCTLVFVGDSNQLPSVGAGNVLKDIINSGEIPVVELKKVYRQEKGSLIVQNSHLILEGKYPIFDQTLTSECMFISKNNDNDKAQSVVSLCTNILKNTYGADPVRDVQILTPTRKGVCGTKDLNIMLSQALNFRNETETKSNHDLFSSFKPNDKVMQTRNDYELKWISINDSTISGTGIFNGDMGFIISVIPEKEILKVLFDDERVVEYNRANIEELELAYVVTVHKSQGSEYPIVVLVLPQAPDILMTRNLLYTAISRAKEKLFIITEKSILLKMIRNITIASRNTLLERFLCEN